jgi:hypothetical protein
VTSGLDQLTAQREKTRSRQLPPPRHPPRSTPVELTSPAVEHPATSSEPLTEATAAPPPLPRPKSPVAVQEPVQEDLAKYSVYFDAVADEYLEATRIAGRKLKPKIAATRSAVVRLALTRLAEQMTAEEAAAELARRAPERTGTGRPRF